MMPKFDPAAQTHGYKLVRLLGAGTFGEVWEAKTPEGAPAALKIIQRVGRPIEARLDLKSLETVKGLDHPSLVKILGIWVDPDRIVIGMALADGTLRQRMQFCRERLGLPGIPPDELVHYTREA